jgi:AraC family transcriptional regulator
MDAPPESRDEGRATWHASGHYEPGSGDDDIHASVVTALSTIATRSDASSRQCAHHLQMALRGYASPGSDKASRTQAGLTRRQAGTALRLINERLDAKLAMSELSAACHISRGHFSRAFKVTFGETPHRFVLMRRIELACSLLATSRDPLADIAVRCGFNDQPHFTRVFKVLTDQTPNAWRSIHAHAGAVK